MAIQKSIVNTGTFHNLSKKGHFSFCCLSKSIFGYLESYPKIFIFLH